MASAQAPGFPILDLSFNMGSASSSTGQGPQNTFQYSAVKFDGVDLQVAPSSSDGATILAGSQCAGVMQNQPSLNQAATVRVLGVSKMVVDGSGTAIVPGNWLKNDTSGRGVVIALPSSSQAPIAMALQNSVAQNDIISVFVNLQSSW